MLEIREERGQEPVDSSYRMKDIGDQIPESLDGIKCKGRTPPWKNIESHAQQVGNYRLHHKIKDKCLFSVEAKYHLSCRKKFDLQ